MRYYEAETLDLGKHRNEVGMLYIVRHGQTEGNVAKLLQGRRDYPLNETGIQQAKAAGDSLAKAGVRFNRVFTSPLGRASHTARIIAASVPQAIDERLIEMEYGPYEGMSLNDPAPEVLAFFKDFAGTPAPDGMEPLEAVVARMGAFLEDIRSLAAETDVLVSTHAIAMKGALEYLTPESRGSYWAKFIGNCAIYVASVDEHGGWSTPREWNETC